MKNICIFTFAVLAFMAIALPILMSQCAFGSSMAMFSMSHDMSGDMQTACPVEHSSEHRSLLGVVYFQNSSIVTHILFISAISVIAYMFIMHLIPNTLIRFKYYYTRLKFSLDKTISVYLLLAFSRGIIHKKDPDIIA